MITVNLGRFTVPTRKESEVGLGHFWNTSLSRPDFRYFYSHGIAIVECYTSRTLGCNEVYNLRLLRFQDG